MTVEQSTRGEGLYFSTFNNVVKNITIKVFINILINTQMCLNTAQLYLLYSACCAYCTVPVVLIVQCLLYLLYSACFTYCTVPVVAKVHRGRHESVEIIY